ncbi:NAD-dependent protein deacylase sirtuin-5B [Nibea albiflora]|uniref:NAD-dependent protein deacylase sirtuin-5B n=1 Tax=Nibea albiflora TaxID=240163 RepID=A0ACB7EME9_NIBAL|nr:NAD-dependent protein deacylase sirtuin-5B [Nibea albiflora]
MIVRQFTCRGTISSHVCAHLTKPHDLAKFRKVFSEAQNIAIITGAGRLATPEAFSRNPSRVWEFYHYRREVMLTKNPNPAHLAIAECEERLSKQGRKVGTSSIVYPAAMFAPQVAARGVPVAEFNMEDTPATMRFAFHFQGPCGTTLPPALARHENEEG